MRLVIALTILKGLPTYLVKALDGAGEEMHHMYKLGNRKHTNDHDYLQPKQLNITTLKRIGLNKRDLKKTLK